jgi:hypothetical protein
MSNRTRFEAGVDRAAAQLYAFAAEAAGMAAYAALLRDDGVRAIQAGRSGSGGYSDPAGEAATSKASAAGAIAVRLDAYITGVTAVIRELERLDRERHALAQNLRPLPRRAAVIQGDSIRHCAACDLPAARLRVGYGDCCYEAWRQYPKGSDPGRDHFTFQRLRRERAEQRAAA